jgi:hypothetical protein
VIEKKMPIQRTAKQSEEIYRTKKIIIKQMAILCLGITRPNLMPQLATKTIPWPLAGYDI